MLCAVLSFWLFGLVPCIARCPAACLHGCAVLSYRLAGLHARRVAAVRDHSFPPHSSDHELALAPFITCVLRYGGQAGRSKGCALVEYASAADAQRAMAELNDSTLMDRPIFVREDRVSAQPAASLGMNMRGGGYGGYFPQVNTGYGFQQVVFGGGFGVRGRVGGYATRKGGVGRRVYVGNLSWECKWQELKDHMRTVGEVVYADVMMGPDGRSKGCGLVEFQNPQEAQRAINELNDSEILGRAIFVREDREA